MKYNKARKLKIDNAIIVSNGLIFSKIKNKHINKRISKSKSQNTFNTFFTYIPISP